jgi:hypothetical protein
MEAKKWIQFRKEMIHLLDTRETGTQVERHMHHLYPNLSSNIEDTSFVLSIIGAPILPT